MRNLFGELYQKIGVFGFLIVVTLFMALIFQGSRGLFEPDEGRYTNVAIQILSRDDWISLYRNEWSMHFTKPPFTYWSIASSMIFFGKNEFAARLPMAIAFSATVLLMFGFGKIFCSQKPWLPAVLYLLSPVPYLAANTINTDTLLCFFLTAFFYCYVKTKYLNGKPVWLDVMWLMLALAFLTKGPPSFLALLVVLIHAACYGWLMSVLRPLGLILFLIIGMLWYMFVIMRHPGLLDYFIGYEVVARIASDTHNRSPEWYGFAKVYLPVLLAAVLPALFLEPWKKKASQELKAHNGKNALLWMWLVLPLIVFSLSGSKMPLYVLWLVPALIIMVSRRLQKINFTRKHMFAALAWGMLLIGVKYFAESALRLNEKDSRQYAEQLRELLPGNPKRLVFVDTSARYGLALYFPVTISKISLQPFKWQISDSPFDHTLTEELANKPSGGRIFLLTAKEQRVFLEQVQRSGNQAVSLGTVGKRKPQLVYTLRSEF